MKPIYKVYITGIVVIGVLLVAAQLLSINDNGAKLWTYVEYVMDSLGDFGRGIKGIFDGNIGIDANLNFISISNVI